MLDEAPPVSVPLDIEIASFRVKVLAPIDNAPVVSVRVPVTVALEVRVTPELLLVVKLFTVAGRPLPVTCGAVPL